jgi:hypothetical protein
MKRKARNSHSIKNSMNDASKKLVTRANKENMGCFERTTTVELTINKIANILNRFSIFFFFFATKKVNS